MTEKNFKINLNGTQFIDVEDVAIFIIIQFTYLSKKNLIHEEFPENNISVILHNIGGLGHFGAAFWHGVNPAQRHFNTLR